MAGYRWAATTALVYVVFLGCFGRASGIQITGNGTIVLDDDSELIIGFDPPELEDVIMGESRVVRFNVTIGAESGTTMGSQRTILRAKSGTTVDNQNVLLRVVSADESVSIVTSDCEFPLSSIISQAYESDYPTNETIQFDVKGLFLGRTRLKYYIIIPQYNRTESSTPVLTFIGFNQRSENSSKSAPSYQEVTESGDQNSSWREVPLTYKVSVIRKERIIDHIFIIAVSLLVFCGNIGMGCKIELNVVKEVLRRPIAPSIGFCSQYIIMPLTSFAVVKLLDLQAGIALGFFALGCSPGGSSSNIYTFLLNGDVSLSITMTLISTLASLAMIPFWLFTLGRLITEEDANTHIPVQNILISLVSLLIPLAIGIIVRRKKPGAADVIIKCMKPFYIGLVVFMFTFGVYTNIYVFKLITPLLCVAGCLLPYVGFLLGGFVAFLFRQPFKRIYTIAIETGLQNTGIPIILLKFSLDQPEADMSVVSPVVTSMFGPMPLWISVIAYEIYKRRCKKKEQPEAAMENLNNVTEIVDDVEDDVEKELMDSQDVNLNSAVKYDKNDGSPGELVVMFDDDEAKANGSSHVVS